MEKLTAARQSEDYFTRGGTIILIPGVTTKETTTERNLGVLCSVYHVVHTAFVEPSTLRRALVCLQAGGLGHSQLVLVHTYLQLEEQEMVDNKRRPLSLD